MEVPSLASVGKHDSKGAEIAENPAPRPPLADIADNSAPRSPLASDTAQLMNGTGFAQPGGNSPSAGATEANNFQGGQALPNRSAGRKAPAATVVRINISALALQNRVFENLLASHGLGIDQNRQQQVASQLASQTARNDVPRSFKNQDNLQGANAGENSQRRIASQAAGGQLDGGKNLQQQLPENLSQKSGGTSQKQETQSNFATNSKPIIYEFDASPEQLAILIKQLGERPDSFSISEIEVAASASQTMNSFAQNSSGGMDRGKLPNRPGEQQNKADAGATKHLVFVFNVVDRLPSAAGRASQVPADKQ
ncbi:MAG: hypothetical protein WCJ35_22455, partial [Planctomycetota bacterium]